MKPKASSSKRSTNESASGQNDRGTKKTCLVLDAPLPRLEAREGAHACHACAAGRLGERTQGLQAGRGAPTPPDPEAPRRAARPSGHALRATCTQAQGGVHATHEPPARAPHLRLPTGGAGSLVRETWPWLSLRRNDPHHRQE